MTQEDDNRIAYVSNNDIMGKLTNICLNLTIHNIINKCVYINVISVAKIQNFNGY